MPGTRAWPPRCPPSVVTITCRLSRSRPEDSNRHALNPASGLLAASRLSSGEETQRRGGEGPRQKKELISRVGTRVQSCDLVVRRKGKTAVPLRQSRYSRACSSQSSQIPPPTHTHIQRRTRTQRESDSFFFLPFSQKKKVPSERTPVPLSHSGSRQWPSRSAASLLGVADLSSTRFRAPTKV